MKPKKFTPSDTKKIDLGTKVIYKYPTPTKDLDIGKMVVNGRHPKEKNTFILEHECQFVIYVIKGSGTIYAGDETFNVTVGDVVFIPKETRFAADGQFEYITVDHPAFTPEQSEIVTK